MYFPLGLSVTVKFPNLKPYFTGAHLRASDREVYERIPVNHHLSPLGRASIAIESISEPYRYPGISEVSLLRIFYPALTVLVFLTGTFYPLLRPPCILPFAVMISLWVMTQTLPSFLIWPTHMPRPPDSLGLLQKLPFLLHDLFSLSTLTAFRPPVGTDVPTFADLCLWIAHPSRCWSTLIGVG
jgi:hypothetical protein